MWVGHSCPTPWTLVWVLILAPQNPRSSNVNGGGQECPPHTYAADPLRADDEPGGEKKLPFVQRLGCEGLALPSGGRSGWCHTHGAIATPTERRFNRFKLL